MIRNLKTYIHYGNITNFKQKANFNSKNGLKNCKSKLLNHFFDKNAKIAVDDS